MLAGAGCAAFGARKSHALESDSWLFHESAKKGFSILQGYTDHESTQISLVVPKKAQFQFHVKSPSAPVPWTEKWFSRDHSDFVVCRMEVRGLRLGETYELIVMDAEGVRLLDRREFQALDLSPRAVRLGFLSCAMDHLHRDDIWNTLAEQKPELVFFLGDNVYGDRPSFFSVKAADPEQMWDRYVATRNRVAFYFAPKLIPVLAIWDDHDFGGNNLGKWYPYKQETLEIFHTFFAQEDRGTLKSGPGNSKVWSAFGADFMMLDSRTFRDNHGADGELLGRAQESWLMSVLQPRPTWLLNGSVFYGAYTGKDSFEGHFRTSFDRLISGLKRSESLACFVSGDVHFSEVMDIEAAQLGYSTFEMVTSSIHSFSFPFHEWRWRNPRRRVSSSSHNFCIFDGEFSDDQILGTVSCHNSIAREYVAPVRTRRS